MAASDKAVEWARAAAKAADDKVATDVVALDVGEHLALTDVFLLASAPNERQVDAVVDAVEEALRGLGAKPLRREGTRGSRWVLLDFGEIVVHVMHDDERGFYRLERLWKDCPVVDVQLPQRTSPEDDVPFASAP